MADLTFYFPSTGSAAHSPSISATWLHEEGATRLPLVSTKSDSARANRKASVWAVGTQTNLAQQYVSAAQAAHEWTTNDSIELQFSAMREANCTAGYMYLIVRVFNADCSSVRGTLYDGAAPTNVSSSQFTNRAMVSGGGHVHVQNAVSMSANDHIVVELGFTSTVSSAWAGCTYKVGDNESSDLPVDETTETWDSYNPWIAFTFATTGYSLSCDGGSYAVTGTAMTPKRNAKVDAAGGTYAITGTAAGAYYGRKVAAEAGSYALTGQASGTLRAAKIDAGAGAYTVTGTDTGLLRAAKMSAEAGSYTLTGADVAALYGRLLAAEAGEYALTGSDAGTYFGRVLAAESGTYAITGSDVTFIKTTAGAYVLTAEGGVYAITGGAAALRRDAKLSAESGVYAITGQDAATLLGRVLDAGAGLYAVTGQAASLIRAAKIIAESGVYGLTGVDASLLVATLTSYVLTAESGAYALTGQSVGLLKSTYGPALKHSSGGSRLKPTSGGSRLTRTRRDGFTSTKIREN